MVIGHGDIASVLPDRDDLLFFASGVSNSQETRHYQYLKEIKLLAEQPRERRLVYFSSLAVFYSNNRYAQHKRYMESLIKKEFKRYAIIRLGNITFGKNPHTLINYLKAHPEAEIQDVYRYIVDKDEFLYWVGMIPKWNVEMNITGRRMKVKDIKKEYA